MGNSDSFGEAGRSIRVLIADNNPMGAHLLADALRRSHRFSSVLAAHRAADVAAALAEASLDVALISADFEGDPGRGFKLAQDIQAASSDTKVVMLLDIPDRDSVVQAFRAGCSGVFCRARSVKELPKCIACVHAGQIWANSQELAFVLAALREPQPLRVVSSTGLPLLTKREMAVVQCVAEGLTNREAAAQLNLSEHTVKNYMFRIFDKLGVSSRVELILYVASQLQSEPVGSGKRSVETLSDAPASAAAN
jgi:two-component system, NarL family, nitrate/nitrite response regulator NarL